MQNGLISNCKKQKQLAKSKSNCKKQKQLQKAKATAKSKSNCIKLDQRLLFLFEMQKTNKKWEFVD
jgi:hypothetical protein